VIQERRTERCRGRCSTAQAPGAELSLPVALARRAVPPESGRQRPVQPHGPKNRAMDIAMPEGTPIIAARAGWW
jgi:murein DD-endopeptidase MepM/ murein hydrolase activator NlpD